jgi:hypothetical protein
MRAAYRPSVEVVDILLQCPGVDVNLVDDQGDSALMYAIKGGRVDNVNHLLKVPDISRSVYATNFQGDTPLVFAAKTQKLAAKAGDDFKEYADQLTKIINSLTMFVVYQDTTDYGSTSEVCAEDAQPVCRSSRCYRKLIDVFNGVYSFCTPRP